MTTAEAPSIEQRAADAKRRLDEHTREQMRQVLKEIQARLNFLDNVGLDYLSLSRKGPTLSGGESQRIRLATQIGSQLTDNLTLNAYYSNEFQAYRLPGPHRTSHSLPPKRSEHPPPPRHVTVKPP